MLKIKVLLAGFLFYFFLSSIASGQTTDCFDKTYASYQKNQLDSALLYFTNCINVIADSTRAIQTDDLAAFFYAKKQKKQALTLYKQLLSKKDHIRQWIKKDSSHLYKDIGYCYRDLLLYKKASKAFESSINLIKRRKSPDFNKIVQLLIDNADCFFRKNDYEKVESILEEGLSYCLNFPEKLEVKHGQILIDLAHVFMWKGNYLKAFSFARKFEEHFFQQKTNTRKSTAIALREIGDIFIKCHEYKIAYKYFNRAASFYYKGLDTEFIKLYRRMGDCQFYLKNYRKSIVLYEKSYKFSQKTNIKLIDEILYHSRVGGCYTNCQAYEKANYHFEKVLVLVNFSKTRKNLFYNAKDKVNLLTYLYFKAKNHLKAYDKSNDINDLFVAVEWYDICIQLIDNIFEDISLNSQQYFLNNAYYIYESIIETNYQLYRKTSAEKYISAALFYAEKSRAILLKKVMREASVEISSGLPDTLFSYEKGLKNKQAALENIIYNENTSKDQAVILKLKAEVAELKNKRQEHNALIQKQYPDYARLLNQKDTLKIEDVRQKLLRPNETMLHYFVGDDHIYILSVSATGAQMVKREKASTFEQSIHDLRKSIYTYAFNPVDSSLLQYKTNAFALYELLIQPLDLPTGINLLIIPDGLLEYVPFDALLQKKTLSTDFTTFPFLILDYNIRYLHAGLLGIQQQQKKKAKYRQVLAIAPSFKGKFENNRRFNALRHNIAEANNIKKYFAVKLLKGKQAKLSSFKKIAKEYACLHLATHAKADNENGEHSSLAFSPLSDTSLSNILYARDISLMDLHAEMVVLSACETAVGNFRRGEGIISLARAFSYAGAESLITTLWRVSDDESEILMDKFYEGLQQGQAKNEALRNAKLHFIQNESPHRAHPFFWAAHIPLGEMNPISLDKKTNFLGHKSWLLLGLCLPFVLFFYYKKKHANTHRN